VTDPAELEVLLALLDQRAPSIPVVVSISTTQGEAEDHAAARAMVATVRAHGGIEVGLNCCAGPADLAAVNASLPTAVRWTAPSTGVGGEHVDAAAMAAFTREAVASGARFVGGCCGTDATALTAMATALTEPSA